MNSLNAFSSYCFNVIPTDRWTDGQPESVMPPAVQSGRRDSNPTMDHTQSPLAFILSRSLCSRVASITMYFNFWCVVDVSGQAGSLAVGGQGWVGGPGLAGQDVSRVRACVVEYLRDYILLQPLQQAVTLLLSLVSHAPCLTLLPDLSHVVLSRKKNKLFTLKRN